MYAAGGIMIQGNTFFQAPVPPTVKGAENGLSLDGAGNAVLGNDLGDATQPGLVLSDRDIPFDVGVSQIRFIYNFNGNSVNITPTSFDGADALNQQTFQLGYGRLFLQDLIGPGPNIQMQAPTIRVTVTNEDGLMVMRASPTSNSFVMDLNNNRAYFGHNPVDNGSSFQIPADMTTGDPGSGQGAWQLGQVQAAAVVFDATRYVETTIDGVTVKLAIVN